MLSLSVAFHIVSALVLIAMFVRLAQYHRRLSLVRRWSDPQSAGIIVGEPLRIIADFAVALDIPFSGGGSSNATPARISLAPVFKLHAEHGIQEIQVSASDGPAVSFVLRRSSATIEEDQRSVERAFSNRLRVSITVKP